MPQADRQNPLPLYLQVREDIRGQIESGAMPPGHRLSFEHDLANQYGVSCVTIKRALRDLVREGLIIRIKRKGTFVSPRGVDPLISSEGPKTLAFIIPDIEDLYVSEIYRGVADEARGNGYRVSILSSDRDIKREAENIGDLGDRGENGAIIFPSWGRANAEQIFDLKKRKFPFVLVSRYFRDIQTDYVVADNRAGACQAVEHLIRLGHRRIGCIGWVECTAVEDRMAGYRLALGRHDIPYNEELVRGLLPDYWNKYVGVEPASGGFDEMKALLRLKPRPTAVFAVSDRVAVGAIRAISDEGLRIPDDLAVVGFDDLRYAADLDLTTVAQPAFEIGKRAVDILIDRRTGSADGTDVTYRQVILPVKLVVRGTCGGQRPAE